MNYKQEEKAINFPFIFYADIGSLLEKIFECHDNPQKSSTSKLSDHTECGYSLFTQCSFDRNKNKHSYYRGKYCMKKFSEDQRKHATEIIKHEKKEILTITKEEQESYRKQ